MADLTKDDVRAMGKAVGLDIQDPELTEVMYSLNALLESLDAINPPGWKTSSPCLSSSSSLEPSTPLTTPTRSFALTSALPLSRRAGLRKYLSLKARTSTYRTGPVKYPPVETGIEEAL